jgi:beta-glucosidase
MDLLNGAWTHSWQGINNGYRTKGKVTIEEALRKYDNVITSSAVLIYCLGEKPGTEVPGNINDLATNIPDNDLKFIQDWKNRGGKAVLVLTLNRPRIITSLVGLFDAVLHAYLPGDEGGRAIADVLYGKQVPSGKLPFTYPRFSGDVVHYDRKHTENNDVNFGKNAYQPLFDFGWGMSYTNFEYSNFEIVRYGDSLMAARVTVRNSGNYDAKEVVQIYASDLFASVTPSVKKLVGFKKVLINKNESVLIEVPFSKQDLTFIGSGLKRQFEGGEFTFSVGCEGFATDEKITIDIR